MVLHPKCSFSGGRPRLKIKRAAHDTERCLATLPFNRDSYFKTYCSLISNDDWVFCNHPS